jgi:Uma2 family endonuclease
MAMPNAIDGWTVEQVHRLPDDGNRYEVIDGRLLVNPPPSLAHQRAVVQLTVLLEPYLAANSIGVLYIAPGGVDIGPRTWVEPDLFVLPLVGGKEPTTFADAGRLMLAIEILSPSSVRSDRGEKRALYARLGTPEYWIVDTADRSIERWRAGAASGEIVRDRITWRPDPERPALVLDLGALFARAG